ncbi:restriction endonuclease subunit S [Gordonia hongkongensis]|uniref:restriction endonuclease subunit S n=1 Tax=Gordonia hongkongensis TaxID=1701090 RepID=UPI003D7557A6
MGESLSLQDVCSEIVDCVNRTAPEDPDGEFFAIGTPAMRGNQINLAEARRLSREVFDRWTRRLVPKGGDILLAREAPVGPVVRVPDGGIYAAGQRTTHLRANPEMVDPRFLYYLLISPEVQQRILAGAMGSTVPHLRVADVKALPLPDLPNPKTQRAIAEILGALDDKIAANQLVVQLLDNIGESAVVQKASTTSSVELRAVADLAYGKALPVASRSTGNVLVYGSGGVVGFHDTALVNGPGIVIGRKGTVGALYWAAGPHFPIDTTYYVVPKQGVSPHILYFALRKARLNELNSDSAVPGLNREEAYGQHVRIPIGSDSEQLANQLQYQFALAASVQDESRRLAETRDRLLPLLMSGKVTIKDIEGDIEDIV